MLFHSVKGHLSESNRYFLKIAMTFILHQKPI
nr:MAG TPA: hypothetical protein [Microviridae sp.]